MTQTEFHTKLKQVMADRGLSEKDVAHACGVSRPIVQRWVIGESSPHPLMRSAVFEMLRDYKK